MFKPHIGDCQYPECTRKNVPIVVKAGWCDKCNHAHKQAKKKAEGKSIKKHWSMKPQNSGQADLFLEVWKESDGRCEVCSEPIIYPIASNFSHILSKALNRFPLFKLYKPNIALMCHFGDKPGCHYKWDHTPRSELKGEQWQKMFEREAKLKEEYKNFKLERNNKK
jgi:hypothetical protein